VKLIEVYVHFSFPSLLEVKMYLLPLFHDMRRMMLRFLCQDMMRMRRVASLMVNIWSRLSEDRASAFVLLVFSYGTWVEHSSVRC
jgi:hypothetical protein